MLFLKRSKVYAIYLPLKNSPQIVCFILACSSLIAEDTAMEALSRKSALFMLLALPPASASCRDVFVLIFSGAVCLCTVLMNAVLSFFFRIVHCAHSRKDRNSDRFYYVKNWSRLLPRAHYSTTILNNYGHFNLLRKCSSDFQSFGDGLWSRCNVPVLDIFSPETSYLTTAIHYKACQVSFW